MKVDLCLWTRNGKETIGVVLDRINQVIPQDVVNQKFIVDDFSTDSTREIASAKGWDIHVNHGAGISDGANTALKFVETDYFCSFEQDLLLSKDWWPSISKVIQRKGVVAASGIRFLPQRNFCYNLEKYSLISQQNIDYGRTLDNTFWNTQMLKNLGGFPNRKYCGVDSTLSHLIKQKGLQWIVDCNVESFHLHDGFLKDELKRYFFYGKSYADLKLLQNKDIDRYGKTFDINSKRFLLNFLKSPVSGLKVAARMRDPRILVSEPSIRLCYLIGYLRGGVH